MNDYLCWLTVYALLGWIDDLDRRALADAHLSGDLTDDEYGALRDLFGPWWGERAQAA